EGERSGRMPGRRVAIDLGWFHHGGRSSPRRFSHARFPARLPCRRTRPVRFLGPVRVLPGGHATDHLHGHALPAPQPDPPWRGLPSRARALLPVLALDRYIKDHEVNVGGPSQTPYAMLDRGAP